MSTCRANRRGTVLALMLDRQWHSTAEIENVAIGGSQGTRRLRELRADGWRIEKRPKANSTQWEYRLVGTKQLELF